MRSPLGFRSATAAALIDEEGYTDDEAEHLLHEWERYARYAMMSGKSPVSTAEHLARFERFQRGAPLQRAQQRDSKDKRAPKSRRRRIRHVSDVDVNAAIADDLRRRAKMIYNDNPEHAREILAVARTIQSERDEPNIDTARIAADVVQQGARPPARDPRSGRTAPRCPRGTEIVSLIFPSDFDARGVREWTREHGFTSKGLEFPPTTGSIRAPQRDTSDFERGSFRTIVLSERENIRAVIGCPRAGREGDKTKQRQRRE